MARSTTTPITGLVRAAEPIGDMPPRHVPRPSSLRVLYATELAAFRAEAETVLAGAVGGLPSNVFAEPR